VLDGAGVPHDHLYVDDACRRLVAAPEAFDVILTPNLFGDIMSDVAAEMVGGLGMAPSGCVGDRWSYFDSVHGSAPDIAGQGIANPLATVLSAQMMLEHLGRRDAAAALGEAVERLLAEGRVRTPDLVGTARTAEVTQELLRLLT
jgi:isocitrate/isopropylmalate dehydrogenase